MADYDSFPDFITAGWASFARASQAFALDGNGDWQPFSGGQLRHINGGAWIEPAETFYPTNSALGGAAVGVVGSGGSLPTGWAYDADGATGTLDVDSIGTLLGFPAITLVWDLENATAGQISALLRIAQAAGAVSESWLGAVWYDEAPEMDDNASAAALELRALDGGGLLETLQSTPLSAGLNRLSAGGTVSEADADTIWLGLAHTLDPGEFLRRTITLVMPTLTQSALLTSPLPTTDSGNVARAADQLTLNLPAGNHDITVTFDNDTTQAFPGESGSFSVPTDMDRAIIKNIAGVYA